MPADVDRVPAWFASFLPFSAPARTVPAQGCVSGQPLNRSPAMALTPSAVRWSPLSASPQSTAATPLDNGRDRDLNLYSSPGHGGGEPWKYLSLPSRFHGDQRA